MVAVVCLLSGSTQRMTCRQPLVRNRAAWPFRMPLNDCLARDKALLAAPVCVLQVVFAACYCGFLLWWLHDAGLNQLVLLHFLPLAVLPADSCPVSCIHWVQKEELPALEYVMQNRVDRVNVGVMMAGQGRVADVFAATASFMKERKRKEEEALRAKRKYSPAQEEARR